MLIINKVQNVILAKGYVTTRVMAQEQDLTTGVLTLTLQPGRVGETRFEEPVSWRGRLWNAIPASRGDILNLRDIEQGLENFRRVPSVNADIKIVPGAEDGTSDLQVNWHEGARCGSVWEWTTVAPKVPDAISVQPPWLSMPRLRRMTYSTPTSARTCSSTGRSATVHIR